MSHQEKSTNLAGKIQNREFMPIPFRIRIGVTGHRTLPDVESVRRLVLQALRENVPDLFPTNFHHKVQSVLATGQTKLIFTILSPLAEGADREVAKATLETPDSRLDVVLPLPVHEYKKDFSSAESLAEFDRLLARCSQPVCLKDELHEPAGSGQALYDRKNAYEAVGRYVVNHCDILLAVWDGGPSRGRGGTAEIVAYAKEQSLPILRIWNGEVKLYNPKQFTPLDAEALFGLDHWNCARIPSDRYTNAFQVQDRKLFAQQPHDKGGPPIEPLLPGTAEQLVRTQLLPYYARGSAIAEACRDRYLGGGWKIYTFSAAAVLFAALGAILGEWPVIPHREVVAQLCFLVELALLTTMIVKLKRTLKAQSHPDWLENRFLTERIRCAVFLAVCGTRPEPIEVPAFMGVQEIDRSWMARVLDEMQYRMPLLVLFEQTELEGLRQFIGQRWLQEQIGYHEEKSDRYEQYLHQLTLAGEIIVPVTIAVALLHILMGFSELGTLPLQGFHRFLTLLALVLPAGAAALAGIETYREFKRLSVRSKIMKTRIAQLERRLASANTPDEFLRWLHKIDRIMLQETQDWMTLMRHVEIKAG